MEHLIWAASSASPLRQHAQRQQAHQYFLHDGGRHSSGPAGVPYAQQPAGMLSYGPAVSAIYHALPPLPPLPIGAYDPYLEAQQHAQHHGMFDQHQHPHLQQLQPQPQQPPPQYFESAPTPSYSRDAPTPDVKPIFQFATADDEPKRRRRTTKHELAVLEQEYQLNSLPTLEEREAIAASIGMQQRNVQVWFQNRRQKEKKEATTYKGAYSTGSNYERSRWRAAPTPELPPPMSAAPSIPKPISRKHVASDDAPRLAAKPLPAPLKKGTKAPLARTGSFTSSSLSLEGPPSRPDSPLPAPVTAAAVSVSVASFDAFLARSNAAPSSAPKAVPASQGLKRSRSRLSFVADGGKEGRATVSTGTDAIERSLWEKLDSDPIDGEDEEREARRIRRKLGSNTSMAEHLSATAASLTRRPALATVNRSVSYTSDYASLAPPSRAGIHRSVSNENLRMSLTSTAMSASLSYPRRSHSSHRQPATLESLASDRAGVRASCAKNALQLALKQSKRASVIRRMDSMSSLSSATSSGSGNRSGSSVATSPETEKDSSFTFSDGDVSGTTEGTSMDDSVAADDTGAVLDPSLLAGAKEKHGKKKQVQHGEEQECAALLLGLTGGV